MTGEQGGERHPGSVLALQPKVIFPSSRYDDGDDDDGDDDDDENDEVLCALHMNIKINHLTNLFISRDRPDFPSLAQTLERLPKKRLARFSKSKSIFISFSSLKPNFVSLSHVKSILA